jgi:hypothetical protein
MKRRAVVRVIAGCAAGAAAWLAAAQLHSAGSTVRGAATGVRGAATGVRGAAGGAPASRLSERGLRRRLAALFTSPRSAVHVGERYLQAFPAQTMAHLFADAGIDCSTPRVPAHSIYRAFAESRRRDFAGGRVVVVDGWVLARCEAACCALLAVSDRGD